LDWGEVIRISEAKGNPKRQKELRTHMNGKFNDISVLMKINNKISLQSPCLKRQYIYSSIEGPEVVLVFERNDAGLKKLPEVCLNKQVTHLPF
jgi:hypothetical protein